MCKLNNNSKQKLMGLLAGLIVVGTSPLVCVAQRPPSRAMSSSLSHAKAAPSSVSSASRVNTPTVMQPQLGVAAVQGSRPNSRPGATWPVNQSVKASRPGSINRRLQPAKSLSPFLVKAQPLLPQRQTLPNRVTSNRNEGTRVGGGQPVVSAVRPGAIGGPIIRPSEFRPTISPGSKPIVTQTRPANGRPLPWRGNPILPDRMASSSRPLGTEFVPKKNLSLGPKYPGGTLLLGPEPGPLPSNSAAAKRPTTTPIVLPSSIISIAKSNSDDGRYDSSKLEPAPTLLTPSGAPLHEEAPKNATAKYAQPKGPLTVKSQFAYFTRYGFFLKKTAESKDGQKFVVFQKMNDRQSERFLDDWLNSKNRFEPVAEDLHLNVSRVIFTNPKSPFFWKPGGTINPDDVPEPWMPATAPEASSDKTWALANNERGFANEFKKLKEKYAAENAAIDAAHFGTPNHQQDGGTGNGNSNPGPNPGGPPAGTNNPDKGGIVGHPSEAPGKNNGSGQGQEDMGPMPPAGETTVEVENEYGPPPEDTPQSTFRGMTDDQYEYIRACLVYGCPDPKSSDDSSSNGSPQDNAGGGGDDSGGSNSNEGNSSSSSNNNSGDDDDDDDDDEGDDDGTAVADNSSSESDDEEGTSDSGYTPGADGSGGSQPAGAEELKYKLFQQLGYLFHSRNFGPRFPLVGDPRPETGGPEGNANGVQGAAQLDPSTFPSGKKNKTGPGKDVMVNGDLRKKTSPVGPDKATAEDGFSDQFLRTFEVIDPVPIDK